MSALDRSCCKGWCGHSYQERGVPLLMIARDTPGTLPPPYFAWTRDAVPVIAWCTPACRREERPPLPIPPCQSWCGLVTPREESPPIGRWFLSAGRYWCSERCSILEEAAAPQCSSGNCIDDNGPHIAHPDGPHPPLRPRDENGRIVENTPDDVCARAECGKTSREHEPTGHCPGFRFVERKDRPSR